MRRRTFLATTAASYAVSSTAAQTPNILGANDRINVALIGCGVRGMTVARLMRQVPNVAFVAACDVYERNANNARQWAGDGCQVYGDFRRVLERRDVHAVLVATPDHWHAPITILACRAGKDVYVEKPLAHNIREGRAMVAAARQFNRVVQCGTQHRSAEHYREVERIVQSGELGKVHFVRVWNYTNDVEIGQNSTTLPLLGNIAFRTGRKIRWNAEREEIINDRQASVLLGRQVRAQWNLI